METAILSNVLSCKTAEHSVIVKMSSFCELVTLCTLCIIPVIAYTSENKNSEEKIEENYNIVKLFKL
jgi:hypothetical protein